MHRLQPVNEVMALRARPRANGGYGHARRGPRRRAETRAGEELQLAGRCPGRRPGSKDGQQALRGFARHVSQ